MGNIDQESLKIGEAAQFLGVSRRTIYRRIWSGELPASKIGGLYYIRRSALDSLLYPTEQSSFPTKEERSEPLLKCGACFRLIEEDTHIGGLCLAEGCEALICTQCWQEEIRHCVKHSPKREEKWVQAKAKFQKGELPVLVRGNKARLREINFLNRIKARVSRFDTLAHPNSGEALTIDNWGASLEEGDQRARVMQLLGKHILGAEITTEIPLNAWVQWEISPKKRQKGGPLQIRAQVLNHLENMLRDGYDSQPLNADALTTFLIDIAQKVQKTNLTTLLVLASPTGWSEDACQVVLGEEPGAAFAHQLLLVYLFDIERGVLIYNPNDARLQGYAELFSPLLHEEKLAEVIENVKNELIRYESLTLEHAVDTMPFSRALLQEAFEKIASEKNYTLTEVPELGTTLVQS